MKETSGLREETGQMADALDEAAFGASIRALQAALERAQANEDRPRTTQEPSTGSTERLRP
jgi:hypothetical protein